MNKQNQKQCTHKLYSEGYAHFHLIKTKLGYFWQSCMQGHIGCALYVLSTLPLFGVAFELFRHERFALKYSRKSVLAGGFWNRFLQDTSQVDWRTKVWITKRLLHGPLRNRNSPTDEPILDGRPIEPTILRVAQHCPVLGFPLQKCLCRTLRYLILWH